MSAIALAVTTSGSAGEEVQVRAKACARRWGLPFFERPRKAALEPMLMQAGALLVFGGDGLTLYDRGGGLRFTPGMARLRIKRIDAGVLDEDPLLKWAELSPGLSVLDCTLGLASDALVAARAVGAAGRVVGLEKSLALFALVSEGLAQYDYGPRSSRVEVVHADATEYLRQAPARSFDVVLLDPMFERRRRSSPAFHVLRGHADHMPLTTETLELARRVARKWVVLKASRYSPTLKRLGLSALPASRSATVVWARSTPIGPAG